MEYFYARVSTVGQNEARQIDAANRVGISGKQIFLDKESGKDFDRTNWKKLMRKLKRGDVLFVKSIDRIGRNYKEIISVWQELTKDRCVDVVVLDMPLLDTRKEKNLLGTFVADLVLQILSFVAENERVNILERQRQGIEAAKARGVRFGRPALPLPDGFDEMSQKYLNGEISGENGAKILGMSQTTFIQKSLRRGKKIKQAPMPPKESRELPEGIEDAERFDEVAERWFSGQINSETAANELGIGQNSFTGFAHKRFPDRECHYRARGPRFKINEQFKRIASLWFEGKTTTKIAAYQFDMSKGTFVKLAQMCFPGRIRKHRFSIQTPENFEEIARKWINGEIKRKTAAKLCGMCENTFARRAEILYYPLSTE